MANLVLEDVVKSQVKLRIAFQGPSGSGKSMSALLLAKNLCELLGLERIVVIDTENKSSARYCDIVKFKVINVSGDYSPATYIQAIDLAEKNGDIVLVDSLSHSYFAEGGMLQQAETNQKRGGSSFSSWRGVSSQNDKLMERLIQSKAHIIATYRTKASYVIEQDARGKSVPRKVGTEPITKNGDASFDYDIVINMDLENCGTVEKTRCRALNGKSYVKPDRELAETVAAWLQDGEPVVDAPVEQVASPAVARVPAAGEFEDWVLKISRAESVTDLESMLVDLKKLDPSLQSRLLNPFRTRRLDLSGQ